jgi:hypothetical protein
MQTHTPASGTSQAEFTAPVPEKLYQKVKNESYWDQLEAKLLFGQIGLDEENLYETIEKRIERLSQAAHSAMGWKTVLDNFDSQDLCMTYEIFNICLKSQFVSTALMRALTPMSRGGKWDDHIIVLIDSLKEVGLEERNPKTVQIWHHEFLLNKECFLNPDILCKYRKAPLPPVLEQNPELRRHAERFPKTEFCKLEFPPNMVFWSQLTKPYPLLTGF